MKLERPNKYAPIHNIIKKNKETEMFDFKGINSVTIRMFDLQMLLTRQTGNTMVEIEIPVFIKQAIEHEIPVYVQGVDEGETYQLALREGKIALIR